MLLLRMQLRQGLKQSSIRPLSLSTPRLVDRALFDEFTRRKSEFRVSAMDDRRVRERTGLHIPGYVLMVSDILFLVTTIRLPSLLCHVFFNPEQVSAIWHTYWLLQIWTF